MMTGRVITLQILIHDEPGRLSIILNQLAEDHVNIMTINSIVPTNGTAIVTISAETMDVVIPLEDMLQNIRAITGVIKAEILAG